MWWRRCRETARLHLTGADMIRFIYSFADIISRPISFALLTTVSVLGSAVALLTTRQNTADVVNLVISVTTMIIGQAVLVSGRRDGLAFHLKLDRIIEALPGDNAAIGMERKTEDDIQHEIDAVEERAAAN